jgi:tetratricopeptide (TPR) repeat protein
MDSKPSYQAGALSQEGKPAPASSLWILTYWKDLLLFVATPALIIPLVAAAESRWTIEEIAIYVAAFGAVGHHLPGMMRAYGDRELFQRFKVRFMLSPLFLLSVCLFFAYWHLNGLRVIFLLWGAWHALAQVYGFVRIYDARRGSFAPLTARLDWLMCLAWFGLGLFYSPGRMASLLDVFYVSGGSLIPAAAVHTFQTAWGMATALVTGAFLINGWWQRREGQPANPIKVLLMATSFGFWYYAMVGINNVLLGIALFEIFHDVQYLSIVWLYNRRRVDKGYGVGAFTRFLFRRSGVLIGLYVGLVFAYGTIQLLADTIDREVLQQSLFGVVTASTLLHFYFDGFIWKVRERSTRQGLGLKGGQADEKSSGRLPGLAHGLMWSLFVIPVCLLGLAEWQNSGSRLEHYRSLAAAVPDSWYAHNKLGLELKTEGQLGGAVQSFRQALALKSDSADVHNNLGVALRSQGRVEEAIVHFRHAVRLRPEALEALDNLGIALASRGKIEEAVGLFGKVLELKPNSAEAMVNLGAALKSQGKLGKAMAYYRRALEADAESTEAHYNLGNLLRDQGKLDQAVSHYRKALQFKPQYYPAHNNLAMALKAQGKLDRAITHYRQALAANPGWAPALNGLAWILATHPDPGVRDAAEAIELAELSTQSTQYRHAPSLDTLAGALAAAGEFDRAVTMAQAALKVASAAQDETLVKDIGRRLAFYRQAKANQERSQGRE